MTETMDADVLRRWIGRAETVTDTIRLDPAHLMEMTLDRDPVLASGDPLPALWHWLYFLKSAPISALGRDGHPARGGFLPPVALPRRMWAGGRFRFTSPLRLGEGATRLSTIRRVDPKQGRTGNLCFVTVEHAISGADTGPAFVEEHDIVYREDPAPDAPQPSPPMAEGPWAVTRDFTATEVLLFRYSALTFNGHRIHYDRDYARDVEGHAGLVVHGPLLATLLMDLAVSLRPETAPKSFDFRAVSPIFDNMRFTLNARPDGDMIHLAAIRSDGALAMKARADF